MNKPLNTTKKCYLCILLVLTAGFFQLNAQSTFQGERLKEACVNFVASKTGPDTEIEISGNIEDQYFNESGVTAKCTSRPNSLKGSTYIVIEFYHGGELLKRLQAPARIKHFAKVPVASRGLSAGEEITSLDFTFERKDITFYQRGEIAPPAILEGSSSKRNIKEGAILTRKMIEEKPVIERGSQVYVIAQSGAVQIKTLGTALQDGKTGDEIRVKTEKSKTVVKGVVTERGAVLIAPSGNQ